MQISWVGDQLVKAATTNVAKMELKSHFCSGTVLTQHCIDGWADRTLLYQTQQRALVHQTRLNKDRMDRRCLLSGGVKPAGPYLHFALQPILLSGGSKLCGKYIEIWNAENTKQAAECWTLYIASDCAEPACQWDFQRNEIEKIFIKPGACCAGNTGRSLARQDRW